jgi:hypothetical protein
MKDSRTFILFLCWYFPAVSVVTGSRIFRPYLVVTCLDFPADLQLLAAEFYGVSGSYLPGISGRICSYCMVAAEFSGRIFSYLPGFSGLTFSGTRRPEFSGRICCFWPGISGRSFSGMGDLKKLYGQQANCSGIYSGIFCP